MEVCLLNWKKLNLISWPFSKLPKRVRELIFDYVETSERLELLVACRLTRASILNLGPFPKRLAELNLCTDQLALKWIESKNGHSTSTETFNNATKEFFGFEFKSIVSESLFLCTNEGTNFLIGQEFLQSALRTIFRNCYIKILIFMENMNHNKGILYGLIFPKVHHLMLYQEVNQGENLRMFLKNFNAISAQELTFAQSKAIYPDHFNSKIRWKELLDGNLISSCEKITINLKNVGEFLNEEDFRLLLFSTIPSISLENEQFGIMQFFLKNIRRVSDFKERSFTFTPLSTQIMMKTISKMTFLNIVCKIHVEGKAHKYVFTKGSTSRNNKKDHLERPIQLMTEDQRDHNSHSCQPNYSSSSPHFDCLN